MKSFYFAFPAMATVAVFGLWLGCDDAESVEGTGGGPGTQPSPFPYTPEGCGFAVDVPDVEEAGLDDGVVGSGAPDHVHVSFAGPSDSSFTVNWRSDPGTTATQLLYGTDRAAVEAAEVETAGVTLATGHHMLYGSFLDGENRTRVHEVSACGLSASTTYFYKVGGPGAWSDVWETSTGPAVGATEPIRIAVSGDSRNEVSVWAEVQAAIYGQAPDLQLFTGDAVAIGADQNDWNAYFEATSGAFAIQDVMGRVPFMVVNGNHENLTVNYVAQFAMPQDETEGELAQGEEWYSFDYGNVHIVALNDSPEASALGDAQRGWLDADLGSVDRAVTPWVFVMHHRPTYSCGGSHESDLDLRAALQPIFDEHHVDIVFNGHDHLYERSLPIRGLDGTDPKLAEATAEGVPVNGSGTLYVVTAGAGAPLYGADDSCPHTHLTESERNYVIVDIEGKKLTYTAYRLSGSVLEEFEYSK